MRTVNILFFLLLIFTFSSINSSKSQLKTTVESYQVPTTSPAPTTPTAPVTSTGNPDDDADAEVDRKNARKVVVCAKLDEYLAVFPSLHKELDLLMSLFRAQIKRYTALEANAKTPKERTEIIEQEEKILKTYINQCLVINDLFKQAKQDINEFKDAHCTPIKKKIRPVPVPVPAPTPVPSPAPTPVPVSEPTPVVKSATPNKKAEIPDEEDAVKKSLIQFISMINLRMKAINMKTENQAFIEISESSLSKFKNLKV
jgi:hypothetical protein